MGRMIVIDGLDGSGKATQAEMLKNRLKEKGYDIFSLDLPYYDDPSSTLVRMYLSGELGDKPGDVNCFAASTFFGVDRYASYKKYWEKEYNSDKIVVANRYTTSNACHQMTKLPEEEWDSYMDWLFDFEYNKLGIPSPDCVIFLEMPVEISQRLLSERYGGDENKKDVHERDTEYLSHCHKAAVYAAGKLGWTTVNCSLNGEIRSREDISDEIYSIVERKLLFND